MYKFPIEILESPYWEIKSCLEMGLGSLCWVALLGQGLDHVASRDPLQSQPLCNPERDCLASTPIAKEKIIPFGSALVLLQYGGLEEQ